MVIRRLGAAVATAVLAVAAAGCAGSGDRPNNGVPARQPAEEAALRQVFGPACQNLPPTGPASLLTMADEPVSTAISSQPMLTDLADALRATNLAGVLDSRQASTVFAPADVAFQGLAQPDFRQLLANPDQLAPILRYHVSGMRYDRRELAQRGSVPELSGGTVTVRDTGDTVTVTDAKGDTARVLCGNIPTANATLFVIDKVLLPAS